MKSVEKTKYAKGKREENAFTSHKYNRINNCNNNHQSTRQHTPKHFVASDPTVNRKIRSAWREYSRQLAAIFCHRFMNAHHSHDELLLALFDQKKETKDDATEKKRQIEIRKNNKIIRFAVPSSMAVLGRQKIENRKMHRSSLPPPASCDSILLPQWIRSLSLTTHIGHTATCTRWLWATIWRTTCQPNHNITTKQ